MNLNLNGSLYIFRCIKTFEVEFSKDQTEFQRINTKDTIFTSYVYSPGKEFQTVVKITAAINEGVNVLQLFNGEEVST